MREALAAADDAELLHELEWCNRRVLARIHRLTLARLRKEIEPVSAAALMRFLLRWQRVARNTPADRRRRASRGSSSSCRASRPRPARGSARCCRRACTATTRAGSISCASPARSCGAGSARGDAAIEPSREPIEVARSRERVSRARRSDVRTTRRGGADARPPARRARRSRAASAPRDRERAHAGFGEQIIAQLVTTSTRDAPRRRLRARSAAPRDAAIARGRRPRRARTRRRARRRSR